MAWREIGAKQYKARYSVSLRSVFQAFISIVTSKHFSYYGLTIELKKADARKILAFVAGVKVVTASRARHVDRRIKVMLGTGNSL